MWAHEALIQGPDGGRPPYSGSPPSLAKRTINAIRRPDGGPIGGRPPYSGGPPIPDKTYHKRDSEARRRPASECRWPAVFRKSYHTRDSEARRRPRGGRPPNAGGPLSTYHKRDSEARRRPDGGRPPNAGGPPSSAKRTVNVIRRPDGGPTEAGLRIPEARHPWQNVPYTRFGGPRRLGTL